MTERESGRQGRDRSCRDARRVERNSVSLLGGRAAEAERRAQATTGRLSGARPEAHHRPGPHPSARRPGAGRPLSKVQGEEEFVEPECSRGQGEEEQRTAARGSDRVRDV